MMEKKDAFAEISHQLDENILAVKGTLEVLDTSVTEEELHELLLKAIERMDVLQMLSAEMLVALKTCLAKIDELKK